MSKKKGDEFRDLMKGAGAASADELAKKWEAECLRSAREAAKRREPETKVTVHSVEARSYAYGYEKFVEEFTPAAENTAVLLRSDESLRAYYTFVHKKAQTLTGGMFSEETRDYPETYELVITIRW